MRVNPYLYVVHHNNVSHFMKAFFDFFSELFRFQTQSEWEEAYLSESVDMYDLERRFRVLQSPQRM